MHNFPTLYKADSSGSVRLWKISVNENRIITEHGQIDGSIQITEDLIKVGKNIGRANATTPEQQAMLEAESKWKKQIDKKGYVQDQKQAAAGENDLRGEECMLAQEYGTILNGIFTAESNKKIKFPAAVQPKLDGHRCRVKSNKTLWSRGHQPINSVPHILQAVQELFLGTAVRLDGELYNHDFNDDLDKISSIVRQSKQLHPEHQQIQYHIYDVDESDLCFEDRYTLLRAMLKDLGPDCPLKLVPVTIVHTHEELLALVEKLLLEGYEGGMVRNLDSSYVGGKRSYDLQKLKSFRDAEFKIVGIVEGKGKLRGHVGAFNCVTDDGKPFDAKLEGNTEFLKQCFENHSLWKDKSMTVRFTRFTKKGKPRNPVAVRIREDI